MEKAQQAEQIIDRLYSRTVNGSLAWLPSAEAGRIQARFGDFLIQLGDPSTTVTAIANSPYFIVKRLSGAGVLAVARETSSVLDAGSQISNLPDSTYVYLNGQPNLTYISVEAHNRLGEIWKIVNSKSQDLDQLLSIL